MEQDKLTMKVTRIRDILGRDLTIRDLVDGYYNDVNTSHVVGFGGKLDIRPEYQREFVYDDKQQAAVIETVYRGFPLNTMYWVRNVDDSTGEESFEVLDGQQRSLSICEYVHGKDGHGNGFAVTFAGNNLPKTFATLQDNEKQRVLDYPLEVYVCEGPDSEKLDWFRVINTVGARMTEQELRNSTYHGSFVSSAKAAFSRGSGKCVRLAIFDNGQETGKKQPLLDTSGDHAWNRQGFLETALEWIADRDGFKDTKVDGKPVKALERYLAQHAKDPDAKELREYFAEVIAWVRATFTMYRKEMKGLPWGIWYNRVHDGSCTGPVMGMTPQQIEARIVELIGDDEVQTVKGIYEYLFTGDVNKLSLREFDDKTKHKVYEAQNHCCPFCDRGVDGHTYPTNVYEYDFDDMEADHIVPWSRGGKTVEENCQMLCRWHNNRKSDK